jgi:uncharacterized membrane protein
MAQDQLSIVQKRQIIKAIQEAEHNTSGEIRVHIENKCKGDVLDRAADVFAMLRMQKTELRNGVLFYVSLDDHQFAVLGDAGINAVVPNNFWESVKDEMLKHFTQGHISSGLALGIELAGEKLKEHFPYQKDDVNELADDISFGNN